MKAVRCLSEPDQLVSLVWMRQANSIANGADMVNWRPSTQVQSQVQTHIS